MRVEARVLPPRAPQELVGAALAVHPGSAFRYIPPVSPVAAAEVGVRGASGERTVVYYVDPYDARVLGELEDTGTAMWVVRRLHSLALVRPVARGLVEAGGWSVLLVGTGLYLWWPRKDRAGGPGGVVTVRGTPRRRVFWRDLHAVWPSPGCLGPCSGAATRTSGPTGTISATPPACA